MRHARVACVIACLVLGTSGCAWFRGKPTPPEGVQAATQADAQGAVADEPAPAAAAEPAQRPVAVAMDFLVMHQRVGNSGLPQRTDLRAYESFLCPSLAQAVRAAQVRQEQARVERPDEKPPWVEGDLFSSLFEGPDGFEARDTAADGNSARVSVAMTHGEGEKAVRWKDTLVLQLDDGIWCLADVEYGGDWASANKGRLADALAR